MTAATWITPLSDGDRGLRVAVKDLIDMEGVPTTAGCRAVAERAEAATADAACLAGIRDAVAAGEARIVGKTNLHELADGITGINPWFGTPVNPFDAALVPGGSSSGSAAAVGAGDADVALGTDTGGSVRIPAACCGITGLKTTWGRVSLQGVWPLAISLDTVGPMARDVAGVASGMALLEPGFRPAASFDGPVGRLRLPLPVDPAVDASLDAALSAAGLDVVPIDLPGWQDAARAGLAILGCEALDAHGELVGDHPAEVGADVRDNFGHAARVGHQQLRDALSLRDRWRRSLDAVFDQVGALALPVMGGPPPAVGPDAAAAMTVAWTLPVNLAGVPALALPVAPAGGSPVSLQLVGREGAEEQLCALGALIEAALA